jgi:hypothetical protein
MHDRFDLRTLWGWHLKLPHAARPRLIPVRFLRHNKPRFSALA